MAFYIRDIINSKSEVNKKLVIVITMSAILAGVLLPSGRLAYSQTIEEGEEEAQQLDQAQQEQEEISIAEITTPIDSFTARGEIGSLVFAVNETEEGETTTTTPPPDGEQVEDDVATSTTTDDIDPSLPVTIPTAIRPPFVLAGDWELQAEGGTVTMFNAGFTMVRTDGTNYHTINLTNFQSTDEGPVTLGPTTERINGTVDVLANGTVLHESQDISITLGGLVMAIHFAEGDTRDHFKGLPVFGTINSIVSADGTTIVGVAEFEDITVEEGPVTPTPELPPAEEQQQPTTGGFTGEVRSPFEPYEGQPEERGLLSPRGLFDPVHPEEGNGVLEALRNPFGL